MLGLVRPRDIVGDPLFTIAIFDYFSAVGLSKFGVCHLHDSCFMHVVKTYMMSIGII